MQRSTISYFTNLVHDQTISREVFDISVAPSKKRIAELRDRRKRLIDDDDEKCIDELKGVISLVYCNIPALLLTVSCMHSLHEDALRYKRSYTDLRLYESHRQIGILFCITLVFFILWIGTQMQ